MALEDWDKQFKETVIFAGFEVSKTKTLRIISFIRKFSSFQKAVVSSGTVMEKDWHFLGETDRL